jgi:hypothetical protein
MALVVKDIAFTDDLVVYNGDFKTQPSDEQHVEHILRTYIGHWKEFPLLGVGIDFYRSGPGQTNKLRSEISTQLTMDGYRVNDISVVETDGSPAISIDYERLRNGSV